MPVIDFPATKPTKVKVTVPAHDQVTGVLHLLNLVVTSWTLLCVLLDILFDLLYLIGQLLHLYWHLITHLLARLSFVPRLFAVVTEFFLAFVSMADEVMFNDRGVNRC